MKIGKELLEDVKDEGGVQCIPFFPDKPIGQKAKLEPIQEHDNIPSILVPETSLKVLSNSELNKDAILNRKIRKGS